MMGPHARVMMKRFDVTIPFKNPPFYQAIGIEAKNAGAAAVLAIAQAGRDGFTGPHGEVTCKELPAQSAKQQLIDHINSHGGISNETKGYIADIINRHMEGMVIVIVPDKPDDDKCRLMGEFKEVTSLNCPECYGREEDDEDCELCEGAGCYDHVTTISWTIIKEIREAILAPHKEPS